MSDWIDVCALADVEEEDVIRFNYKTGAAHARLRGAVDLSGEG